MANFAGFVVQSGYEPLLAALTAGLAAVCHLYVNDPVYTDDMSAGSFVEIAYAGYGPLPLERWSPPATHAGVAYSVADPLRYAYTSGPVPLPAQGCYVTDGIAGPLLWAWRRPGGAFQMDSSTPYLTVIATLTLPGLASYVMVARGGRAEGGGGAQSGG